MKKIALIIEGDPSNIRGAFIASHNRAKNIVLFKEYKIDLYLLQTYRNAFICFLSKKIHRKKYNKFTYDGLTYKNLWLNSSILDFLLRKIKKPEIQKNRQIKNLSKLFGKYDLLSVHSKTAGYLALITNQFYSVPFAVTWHGSDIHTHPFASKSVNTMTKSIMEAAVMNFFVSEKLLLDSKYITLLANCKVLYNGVDNKTFYPYSEEDCANAKIELGINTSNYNVLFIGDFHHNKNLHCMPEILSIIKDKIPNIELFIGGYEPDQTKKVSLIEFAFLKRDLDVKFLGQIQSKDMPTLINSMNLCVLPSFNEGLPLFAIESLACKVPFVGSRVGGIPEIIGIENTVPHSNTFDAEFAKLCIKKILHPNKIELNSKFDWEEIAKKEFKIYNKILKT